MYKKRFAALAVLAIGVFFLSSCDTSMIEPPNLDTDDNNEDYNHYRGDPASWGAGDAIMVDGTVPGEPAKKPAKVNESAPESWGSGEPIMNDGSVPGESPHKPAKVDENTPESWGSGEPIMNDGSVPGEPEKEDKNFRGAVNNAGDIYKPKSAKNAEKIYYYNTGESSSEDLIPKAPPLRQDTPDEESSECGG